MRPFQKALPRRNEQAFPPRKGKKKGAPPWGRRPFLTARKEGKLGSVGKVTEKLHLRGRKEKNLHIRESDGRGGCAFTIKERGVPPSAEWFRIPTTGKGERRGSLDLRARRGLAPTIGTGERGREKKNRHGRSIPGPRTITVGRGWKKGGVQWSSRGAGLTQRRKQGSERWPGEFAIMAREEGKSPVTIANWQGRSSPFSASGGQRRRRKKRAEDYVASQQKSQLWRSQRTARGDSEGCQFGAPSAGGEKSEMARGGGGPGMSSFIKGTR